MVIDNGRFMTSELSNITQMLEEHFRIALSAIRIVTSTLDDWLNNAISNGLEELAKITPLEEKGDELKRLILLELAKAQTLMQREDLLRLVHYNDKLIDGAEIAARHLANVIPIWAPEGELREKVALLGQNIIDEITQQREAVRFLSLNMETSMTKADEICVLEKKIDALHLEIISLLYASKLDIAILLRFRDFLNMMEDISNFSEDAAITIRSLSLTLNI
jgi:predicted phosphate transport protein (TIGR00153 family)